MNAFQQYQRKKVFNESFAKQFEKIVNKYRLYILSFCILILFLFIHFESKSIFPSYVPVFLMVLLVLMFLYYSYVLLKAKILQKYGKKYNKILSFIDSIINFFDAPKTKILTDSFRAKSYINNRSLSSQQGNFSFDSLRANNTSLNMTIPDKPNYMDQNRNNQENDKNYLNIIKSTEKKRPFSNEPHEIKRKEGRFSEGIPSFKPQIASITKNIKGFFIITIIF